MVKQDTLKERNCFNCKLYEKCCKSPKMKVFPYLKELTCFVIQDE